MALLSQLPLTAFAEIAQKFNPKTFENELTREGFSQFWALLMKGYASVLSPEKSWGIIDPEYRQWLRAKGVKGDPELVTRVLFGLSAWLSNEENPTVVEHGNEKIDLVALFKEGMLNGTNPESKGYWNPLYGSDNPVVSQYGVEAPAVALSFYLTKHNRFVAFTKEEKRQIGNWVEIFSDRIMKNNWSLFHAITATVCKKEGWKYSSDVLEKNLANTLKAYEGDGWFSDGAGLRKYDDYNNWVYASFLMYWVEIDGDAYPPLKERTPEIIKALTQHQQYFYGSDGSHPEYGRSITYKFARLAPLIIAHRMGYSSLSAGLVKRIVRLHIQHYVKNGAIDTQTGVVAQTLDKNGSLRIRDVYNFTGSTYWFMQTIGALWMLDENDSFWSAKEQPLPVEEADFSVYLKEPSWMLVGTKQTGSIVLYNVGTDQKGGWNGPTYPAKYRKYAYHSQLGVLHGTANVVPCDNMPVLTHEEKDFYPAVLSYSREGNVLRMQQVYEEFKEKVIVSSILIIDGEDMIRFHKIQSPSEQKFRLKIGGYALGSTTQIKKATYSNGVALSSNEGQQSLFFGLETKDWSLSSEECLEAKESFHSKFPKSYLPYFEKELTGIDLLAIATRGSKEKVNAEQWRKEIRMGQYSQEKVKVKWKGRSYKLSFL